MKIGPDNLNVVENQFDEWTKAFAHRTTRRKTLQLLWSGLFGAFLAPRESKSWAASSTTSAAPTIPVLSEADDETVGGLAICRNQEYALCAGVHCFVYNNVAYCRCTVKYGDSVSRKLSYAGGDVCNFMEEGRHDGLLVSTFSVPPQSVRQSGTRALYYCPPSNNSGAYASCDGGICFASTRGQSFPGLGQLKEDQIVCSCPIAYGNSDSAPKVGHQIFGPHPCEASFFDNCKSDVATGKNGSYLYEAAPTGSYEVGALVLEDKLPHFNICFP